VSLGLSCTYNAATRLLCFGHLSVDICSSVCLIFQFSGYYSTKLASYHISNTIRAGQGLPIRYHHLLLTLQCKVLMLDNCPEILHLSVKYHLNLHLQYYLWHWHCVFLFTSVPLLQVSFRGSFHMFLCVESIVRMCQVRKKWKRLSFLHMKVLAIIKFQWFSLIH